MMFVLRTWHSKQHHYWMGVVLPMAAAVFLAPNELTKYNIYSNGYSKFLIVTFNSLIYVFNSFLLEINLELSLSNTISWKTLFIEL